MTLENITINKKPIEENSWIVFFDECENYLWLSNMTKEEASETTCRMMKVDAKVLKVIPLLTFMKMRREAFNGR